MWKDPNNMSDNQLQFTKQLYQSRMPYVHCYCISQNKLCSCAVAVKGQNLTPFPATNWCCISCAARNETHLFIVTHFQSELLSFLIGATYW